MSLLLVSNDINHQGNFKGKSCITHCENSKSGITLCPTTPHASNLRLLMNNADNLGSIMRDRKPLCHPVYTQSNMLLFLYTGVLLKGNYPF